MAHLHSQREILSSKRDHESRNVTILELISSPIRRVPTEVLREIFICCLPKAPTAESIRLSNWSSNWSWKDWLGGSFWEPQFSASQHQNRNLEMNPRDQWCHQADRWPRKFRIGEWVSGMMWFGRGDVPRYRPRWRRPEAEEYWMFVYRKLTKLTHLSHVETRVESRWNESIW